MSNLFVDNFGKRDQSAKITADTLLQGTAKAWLNMNGTGTIAQRDSFNVSSITDNGTGNYTMTFAIAQPSANYSFQLSVGSSGGGVLPYVLTGGGAGPFAGYFRATSRIPSDFAGNAALSDVLYFCPMIHGDPV